MGTSEYHNHCFSCSSPYTWGPSLQEDSTVFWGREDVFEFLRIHLWGEKCNKIIVLQGERRIGKTSILHQLKKRQIFGVNPVVYFDLQARYANWHSIPEFLYHFSRRLMSEASLSLDLQVDQKDFVIACKEDYDLFESWLDKLELELDKRGQQIIIVFDEFEKLLGRRFDERINPYLVEELLQYLRSVMLSRKRLNWIIAGSWTNITKQHDYFSSHFEMALSYWISYLKREDAISLIQEPVRSYLLYEQDALERILFMTGCHPFYIQILCDELFNRACKLNRHRISADDINEVVDYCLTQVAETHFRMVWASLAGSSSRHVLATVAMAAKDPYEFISKDTMLHYLHPSILAQDEHTFYTALNANIRELVRRELIEISHDGNHLRIRYELLYRWLCEFKPLTTVLQEELKS